MGASSPGRVLRLPGCGLVVACCCCLALLLAGTRPSWLSFDDTAESRIVGSLVPGAHALALNSQNFVSRRHHTSSSSSSLSMALSRSDALHRIAGLASVSVAACWAGSSASIRPALAAEEAEAVGAKSNGEEAKGLKVYQTPSGLKYIDLQEGRSGDNDDTTSGTPRYGQLLSISYQAYVTLPGKEPQRYDAVAAYVLKHGNGRLIAGLEEGLHTMRVGAKRRLLIPPKLGYVNPGLGPIPELPWRRDRLNSLLDEMIEKRGGTIVMEVTLLGAIDDEADQGYYEDDSLTPEQFETLKQNLQKKGADAAARE
jgi:FKBP-type peptidyl-prolyl cis-trans isomerase